jgi:hypothetical protein
MTSINAAKTSPEKQGMYISSLSADPFTSYRDELSTLLGEYRKTHLSIRIESMRHWTASPDGNCDSVIPGTFCEAQVRSSRVPNLLTD